METPNFITINKLANGDEAVKKMILDVILEEFPQEKANYFENFKSRDLKKTQENVHKLKHKISVLGLEKSYEIANVYEKNLLNNSIDQHQEFEKVLQIITNFVNTL